MRYLHYIMLVAFSVCILSCESDDPAVSERGDYFPLRNLDWTYERLIGHEPQFYDFGDITIKKAGMVEANGKIYTRIIGQDGYIDFEARREGTEYFERNALFSNDQEYKFLDTKKNVGESWSYNVVEHIEKVVYTISSKNVSQKINNRTYHNVITVNVDYYTLDDFGAPVIWLSAQHVYAKDLGEVYSFVPYPISLVYGDVKSTRTTQ